MPELANLSGCFSFIVPLLLTSSGLGAGLGSVGLNTMGTKGQRILQVKTALQNIVAMLPPGRR